jgi:hypothetical protein
MTLLRIKAGPFDFEARLEQEAAPRTCERFLGLLPYKQRIIHVRWSGEACWIPLGNTDFGLGFENATSYRRLVSSSSILVASAKPNCFWRTEESASRARWANSRAIIS